MVIIYGRGGVSGIPEIARTQNVPPSTIANYVFAPPLQNCALKSFLPLTDFRDDTKSSEKIFILKQFKIARPPLPLSVLKPDDRPDPPPPQSYVKLSHLFQSSNKLGFCCSKGVI